MPAGEKADDPPTILVPLSLTERAVISLCDMGIERRYLPGTVLPEITTDTSARGIAHPPRTMSTVMYLASVPASVAAPYAARAAGDR